MRGQARWQPAHPRVEAGEARGGNRAVADRLRHYLGEELIQREQRDDGERGQVPAPARAEQAGQGRRDEPGQGDAEQNLQQHRDHRDDNAECAAGQADRHAEQADDVCQRPETGERRRQQAGRERPRAQRVQREHRGVERAVHAEDQDRRYQPAEREHGEDDRRELYRGALAAEPGQDEESGDREQHSEHRADDEGGLGGTGRAQGVDQPAQLQLDEEPSHDSTSSSAARGPTRSMNARCSVLPPRTSSMVPVTTIRPLSMIDTWSQTCSTSSITWLENSTVEPDPANRVSSRRITSPDTGSTPSSGSSRNSTGGLWISAQPSAAFLRTPVE